MSQVTKFKMPFLCHINLPLSPFSFFSSKSCPIASNHALSLHGPHMPSFHMWLKGWSMLSWLITIQVAVNFSILEQVETSEKHPFISRLWMLRSKRVNCPCPRLQGELALGIFFFLITTQEEEKNWFCHKFCSIDRYLLSNYYDQQWTRHWNSRNK